MKNKKETIESLEIENTHTTEQISVFEEAAKQQKIQSFKSSYQDHVNQLIKNIDNNNDIINGLNSLSENQFRAIMFLIKEAILNSKRDSCRCSER